MTLEQEHLSLMMQQRIASRLTIIMGILEKDIPIGDFAYSRVWVLQDHESTIDMLNHFAPLKKDTTR